MQEMCEVVEILAIVVLDSDCLRPFKVSPSGVKTASYRLRSLSRVFARRHCHDRSRRIASRGFDVTY
ncbi:hypothetical protein F01_560011 [Burkholderia cenocepacia]|nr:hypothetical protein F01_560011 [Burkholderia cenocepacia]